MPSGDGASDRKRCSVPQGALPLLAALDPDVVLLEHPTVAVDRRQVGPLGEHIRMVARRRGAAVVALTADTAFANAVATRVLTLDPSSRAGMAHGKPERHAPSVATTVRPAGTGSSSRMLRAVDGPALVTVTT